MKWGNGEWEDDREGGGKKAEVGEQEGGEGTSCGNPDDLQKERVEGEGKKDVGGCEVRSGPDQPVGVVSHDFQLETINFQNRQHHNSTWLRPISMIDSRGTGRHDRNPPSSPARSRRNTVGMTGGDRKGTTSGKGMGRHGGCTKGETK